MLNANTTFEVDNGSAITEVTGTASGTAALVKQGAGTLTFTGANAYTGGTTISAGALQIGNGGTTGSIVGNVTDNGTLAFNRSDTITFGGAISGTGSVIQAGPGTLTFTGANNYAGGTTINAGTVAVGNNSALGTGTVTFADGTTLRAATNGLTIANAMVLNGTATADPFLNSPTLSGAISGSGGLTKSDFGNLTLSGPSTYFGPTAVLQDALVAGGTNVFSAASAFTIMPSAAIALNGFSQTIGSLAGGGEVNNNTGAVPVTLTTGGDNTSTTFSGIIHDGGAPLALTKTGTGTFTLTATNTYTGATTVNAGTLEVDGSIANTSSVTVNSGGTLSGTGIVDPATTTINSGGTLAPGNASNPTGTLSITGNLAFQSGALYVVQVTPSAAASTNVSGTATLTGATVNAQFASGSYLAKQYTILTATGGLAGTTFATLTNTNLPAGFSDSLSHSGNSVFLNLTANLGAIDTGGLNQNQQNVATRLNNFFNGGGALPPNFVNVFGLTGGGLANALTQLDGEAATGAERAVFQLTNEFLTLMLDPFVNGRGNAGAGGPALGFAPDEQANLPPDIALAYAAILTKAPPPSFEQRWSAWGSAYGGANNANGDPAVGSNNVTAQTFGFAAGMDYHFTPDTVVGFALAGGGTNWGLAMRSALDAATHSRPASTASAGSVRLTSPARSPSPITGSRPTARRSAMS